MQTASLLPNVFAGRCALCLDSKRWRDCQLCGCVSYCCAEHQKADLVFHAAPCKTWQKLASSLRRTSAPGADIQRETALAALPVHNGELHQLTFHRCCCVCRSTRGALSVCAACEAVYFCAVHTDATHPCAPLHLALTCESLLAAYGHRPPVYAIAPPLPAYQPLPAAGWAALWTERLQCAQGARLLSPAARALACAQLSLAMTVLWALQASRAPVHAAAALVVHVLGPRLPEVVSLRACEEILHRLPALQQLQVVLVGPELGPVEAADPDYAQFQLCAACVAGGRRASVQHAQALYHEYAAAPDFVAPHVAVALNAGLFLYPSWRASVQAVLALRDTLFVVTAHDERDARCDAQVVAELRARVVLPPSANPYHGCVAVRRPENLCDVYYRSGWLLAVTGRRSTLWPEGQGTT